MSAKLALFESPNLDCLSIDPDDLREAANVLHALAQYARRKAEAMEHRLAGNVNVALILEAQLDAQYRKLPEWARW